MRICKNPGCKKAFSPKFNTLQKACSIECAVKLAEISKEKIRKKEIAQAKRKFLDNDRGHWVQKLDKQFNQFIRLRDRKNGCISCGKKTGQMQAGHYRPKGSHGNLRWHEKNCWGQCSTCNNHKSGNLTEYRKALVAKIGAKQVEWLEGPHEIRKALQIDEIKALIKVYQQKIKELSVD